MCPSSSLLRENPLSKEYKFRTALLQLLRRGYLLQPLIHMVIITCGMHAETSSLQLNI